MSKYCKYAAEKRTLDTLDTFIMFYVIEGVEVNNTLSFTLTTNNLDYHCANIWIIKNFTEGHVGDYVKTEFDTDVEMLEDIQQTYKTIFKLESSRVFVFCDDAYSEPKILISIDESYLVYSRNNKRFGVLSNSKIESKINDESNYVEKYTNVKSAFSDPIFKNYVDILNEI